MQVTVGASEGE